MRVNTAKIKIKMKTRKTIKIRMMTRKTIKMKMNRQ